MPLYKILWPALALSQGECQPLEVWIAHSEHSRGFHIAGTVQFSFVMLKYSHPKHYARRHLEHDTS